MKVGNTCEELEGSYEVGSLQRNFQSLILGYIRLFNLFCVSANEIITHMYMKANGWFRSRNAQPPNFDLY